MLTPGGNSGAVQVTVAVVEFTGSKFTSVGGATARVWVILEEFWELVKRVESVVAEPLYEYKAVFITIVYATPNVIPVICIVLELPV
jgi:hypothetical protein